MPAIVSKKKLLAMMIGCLLTANQSALAAVQGAVAGNGITLNPDDVIEVKTGATAADGYGIKSDTVGEGITVNGSTIHISSGDGSSNQAANGVYLSNQNSNSLGDGTKVQINVANEGATGIIAAAKGTTVSADNLTVDISGTLDTPTSVVGALILTGAELNLGQNSHINIDLTGASVEAGVERSSGIGFDIWSSQSKLIADALQVDVAATMGHGLYQRSGSADFGHNSVVNAHFSDATKANISNGIYSKGSFTADHLTVDVGNATGVKALSKSQVNLGSGSQIKVSGASMAAILASGNTATVTADSLLIDITAAEGFNSAQTIGLHAENGAVMQIGAGSQILAGGGRGIVASGLPEATTQNRVEFKGTEASRNAILTANQAVEADGNTSLVDVAYTDIVIAAGEASTTGIRAQNSGQINLSHSTIAASDNAVAVAATSGGQIHLDQITIQAGEHDRSALYVQDDNSQITVTGKTQISGNLAVTGNDALLAITTDAGSNLIGATLLDSSTSAQLNLNLTDSIWNMTDNSQVSTLVATGSKINFTNADFRTLQTEQLSGSAHFSTKVDIVGQQGDLIVVNGTAQGEHQLTIQNQGEQTTDGHETLTVVKVADNQADFSLSNQVELGAYQYDLRAIAGADGTEYELYATNDLSSSAQAAGSFLNIGFLTNYLENQTLLQRLGDLRHQQQSGVWLKSFAGKLSAFSDAQFDGFNLTYSGMQLGTDTRLDSAQGKLLVGMMAGYTHTNPHYLAGSGSGKSYHLGYYATYLHENDWYWDAALKFNYMQNRFSVADSAGDLVSGSGKTSGITLSSEIGKRFWLTQPTSGLYLEPQAQLTYLYQTGDTVQASNQLQVTLSDYQTTLARLSTVVGYQQDNLNLYLKVGALRALHGNAAYRFNAGEANRYQLQANWLDSGIGLNLQLGQSQLYAEFDYTYGQQFNRRQLDLGYRFTF